MANTLGVRLKELRELSGLTLRQVEEASGVSNAYLSLLESEKIKKPSANTLYKLANIYGTSIDDLLQAAGIINTGKDIRLLKLPNHKITTEEEKALLDYLGYLRWRERKRS